MSQKMEFSLISFMAAIILLFGDNVNCQEDIIVNFYAQQVNGRTQIIEGDAVIFVCQVSNEFNDNSDSLFINNLTSEGFVQLATETDASSEWDNNILAFTKDDISKFDAGNYQCVAARGFTVVQQLTITMNVLFPALGQPVCETLPSLSDLTLYEGDEITLRCSSDAGNPILHLQWSNDKSVDIPNANTHQISPNNVMSEITVTLNSTHNGVIFACIRDNPSFPSNQEFCNIGPLTVKDKRLTTLAQTISSETIIPPTAESLTTAAKTMESKSATSTDGIDVIVAIVVVFIIVIGIVIVIVIFLVKSGRCASILKSNKDDSRTENVSLEAGRNNGKVVVKDHSHDNPAVDANHVLSPNGCQLYAVVQKNTPARESCASGDTSKVYPTAPEYPRPEKTRQSDGDLYANAGIVRDEASGESPDNPGINSAVPKDIAGISSEKSNDCAASGMNLYADPSEIASGEPADASLIGTTRKQDDSEMALYANPSEVIPDNSHMPAPSEAPPAPPAMAHTPGLDYANLDIARPASLRADGRVDIISNEDQVVYAFVK